MEVIKYSISFCFCLFLFIQDWPYPDGDPPPDLIIDSWLDLTHSTFSGEQSKSKIVRVLSKAASSSKGTSDKGIIAIHCIAGLGRCRLRQWHRGIVCVCYL